MARATTIATAARAPHPRPSRSRCPPRRPTRRRTAGPASPPELAEPGWGASRPSASGPSPARSAGAAGGVGSKVTQPSSGKATSTQEWASRSRTRYSPVSRLNEPGENPETTRAGMPDILSMSAIAPENCWQ